MDRSTNGQIALRSVNSRPHSNSNEFASKETEKKRSLLRSRNRKKKLIDIWRFTLQLLISYGLVITYITKGSSPINKDKINVKGDTKFDMEMILSSSNLKIPLSIIETNPKDLESKIASKIPIKAISIRRKIIPPSLEIEIIDRKPIAYANRRTSSGEEEGMIDKDGEWIPLNIAKKAEPPKERIFIEGWLKSHKTWLKKIIAYNDKNGGDLQTIIISPTGELSFLTKNLGKVQLGENKELLNKQLKALSELNESLPEKFKNSKGTVIDLSEPMKPELQMPISSK